MGYVSQPGDLSHFRPVVVAPTFDNAGTLPEILREIDRQGLPTIVVNDGCTDGTAELLAAWQSPAAGRFVIEHKTNRGKARALRNGFAFAHSAGFTHAVTIDTDGQLDPAEIPRLLEIAERQPEDFILGTRDDAAKDYPRASRLGRRASNLLLRWESRVKVSDSQCGFRVYPLRATLSLRCRAERYGFETEVLARAAQAGMRVTQTPVRCTYSLPQKCVSHFRPWRDSLSAVGMHARLLCEARLSTRICSFLKWINPMRLARELAVDPKQRDRCAWGLAIGVFVANLPIYGFQSLLCLFVAKRLRLNPASLVMGAHISTPPIGPLMIALAIATGHVMIHHALPTAGFYSPQVIGYWGLLRRAFAEWVLGGVACGIMMGAITLALMRLLLRRLPLSEPECEVIYPTAPAAILVREAEESTA